jgi:predicted HTH domain antitoxin
MTLTLPETKFSEGELKQELALSLYAARKVTIIQAVHISGIGFFEFQGLLKERQIPQHYDVEDLEQDMRTIQELREIKKR